MTRILITYTGRHIDTNDVKGECNIKHFQYVLLKFLSSHIYTDRSPQPLLSVVGSSYNWLDGVILDDMEWTLMDLGRGHPDPPSFPGISCFGC